MAQIICIEGNIGSGKSTFVQFLKTYYEGRSDICFLDEPVDLWLTCKDEEGNILEHYYKDQKAYGFKFQMLAYISRLSILKKAVENKQYKYIISERSLFTDRNVFCKMLYDEKMIDEIGYQIYNMWFEEFNVFSQNTKYIYLKTLPETSYERVLKRERKGETIPLEYLAKCSDYHDSWLLQPEFKDKVLAVFDANVKEQDTHKWTEEMDKIIKDEDIIEKGIEYLKEYIDVMYRDEEGIDRWIDEHFNSVEINHNLFSITNLNPITNLKNLKNISKYCAEFEQKYNIDSTVYNIENIDLIRNNFLFYLILENQDKLF